MYKKNETIAKIQRDEMGALHLMAGKEFDERRFTIKYMPGKSGPEYVIFSYLKPYPTLHYLDSSQEMVSKDPVLAYTVSVGSFDKYTVLLGKIKGKTQNTKIMAQISSPCCSCTKAYRIDISPDVCSFLITAIFTLVLSAKAAR